MANDWNLVLKNSLKKLNGHTELAKMKGNTEEARSINSYLDMMRSKVLSAEMELLHKRGIIH